MISSCTLEFLIAVRNIFPVWINKDEGGDNVFA